MAHQSSRSGDDRFEALSSDPRYRLPSSKNGRIAVDKRFSRMFRDHDGNFGRKTKVDKYGRRVEDGSLRESKHLQRLYQEANSDEDEGAEGDKQEAIRPEPRKGGKARRRQMELASASDESDDADSDGQVRRELRRVQGTHDPAREGGFSSSSEESSSEEEVTEDADLAGEEQVNSIPMGDASTRLAVVNMDWDNIRALDILAVASSFVPTGGHIKSVSIYPSEFGKERLEREELEGPPKEIFASGKKDARSSSNARNKLELVDHDEDETDDETIRKKLQAGDAGEEFDTAALRRYQLERLRYFYAIIVCSTVDVAQAIYSALDTREYLSTANFFDLRFIPDEVTFEDDKPRDEATALDAGYKPNEFVTEALTHSKVKLTWDADDATRKEVQKRAFSRNDIDENDMRAYIGGDSSSENEDHAAGQDGQNGLSKKEVERQRMRQLLGLANEKRSKGDKEDKPVGDMQITFTAGLSGREGRDGVFENSPPRDETTMERYVRKEKERKAKRREKMKERRQSTTVDETDGGNNEDASGSEIGGNVGPTDIAAASTAVADDSADPFDDPFFNDPEVASKSQKEKQRKEERVKRREAKRAQQEKEAAERSQLELLMDDGGGKMRHFDMKEIQKTAKRRSKKGKKDKKNGGKNEDEGQKGKEEDGNDDDDDGIETSDPRFTKLFESHDYAIDPTNPRFQKTEGMQKILEEGRKRRRDGGYDEDSQGRAASKREKTRQGGDRDTTGRGQDDHVDDDTTQRLLARVKARSTTNR